jgi:hypothetical protein
MNCRLSLRRKETFSEEYKNWFRTLQNLQDGIYILNLSDQVIIRKDGKLPWGENFFFEREPKYLPVFSLSGAKNFFDIPMPNYDDIILFWPSSKQKPNPLLVGLIKDYKEIVPWNEKQKRAVFRGGPTGCGLFPETNARLGLAEMASRPDLEESLDAGIVELTGPVRYDAERDVIGNLIFRGKKKERMEYQDQAKFKYIIHIDGNVAAYRLASTMLLGSVILKVEGDYTLWYENLLVKWDWTMDENKFDEQPYNCIAVKGDLTNLIETIEMCRQSEERDAICKRIAENGVRLAQKILNKDFIDVSFANMLLAAHNTARSNETIDIDETLYPPPDSSGDWVFRTSKTNRPGQKYWYNTKTKANKWVWDNPPYEPSTPPLDVFEPETLIEEHNSPDYSKTSPAENQGQTMDVVGEKSILDVVQPQTEEKDSGESTAGEGEESKGSKGGEIKTIKI